MAVAGNGNVLFETLPNPSLPEGQQRWRAFATATGDVSGGLASLIVNLNPGQLQDWQPFVALYDVHFVGVTADPTDGELIVEASGFEDLTAVSTADKAIATLVTSAALVSRYQVAVRGPWYLGRLARGQLGRIYAEFPNVNTAVYRIWMSGVLSQRPFVANDMIRV